jgi:hypothetical protein
MNDIKHGDTALEHALNPSPGRSSMNGFTIPGRKPKAPVVPTGRIGPPKQAPLRYVDGLPIFHATRLRPKLGMPAAGSSIGVMNANVKPITRAPLTRSWGPHAVLRDLERRGHVVTLTTDKQHLVVQSRGAKLMATDLALLRASEPLVLPFLRGDPFPVCNSGEHPKKVDTSASTVGPTGNLLCIWHLEQRGE